jgi:hypothetical protein
MAPSDPRLAEAPPRPAPAIPASTTAAGGPPQYEFSPADDALIGNLGSKMAFVGLFMLGIGVFFFVSVIVQWIRIEELDVSLLFLTLLFMILGIWTHRAGREFRSVSETKGRDMSHLLGALGNLLKFYTLLYILFLIGLVFAIIQLGASSLYGVRAL